MLERYPKFGKCVSYCIDNLEEQIEINDKKIIDSFEKLLIKLESQNQTILCCRGTNKINDLGYRFVVGEKSNSHFNSELEEMYSCHYLDNEKKLVEDITILKEKVRIALEKREKEFFLEEIKRIKSDPELNFKLERTKALENYRKGRKGIKNINLMDVRNLDIYELYVLKIFFLRIEHTDGRNDEFNSQTPFLSLTYGSKKFDIARKFSLDKSEKGIIYLYSLFSGELLYFRTKDLSKKLNLNGITWHKDIYNEITLLSGMFPHFLLAIYEVKKNSTPKLIINPYLLEILENNAPFDFIDGLSINQENFPHYAKKLGYKTFFTSEKGVQTINDINNNEEIGRIGL